MCKKLEPCGCGEDAFYSTVQKDGVVYHEVACYMCGCGVTMPVEAEAIKAWNTRKASKPIGVDEVVKQICNEHYPNLCGGKVMLEVTLAKHLSKLTPTTEKKSFADKVDELGLVKSANNPPTAKPEQVDVLEKVKKKITEYIAMRGYDESCGGRVELPRYKQKFFDGMEKALKIIKEN